MINTWVVTCRLVTDPKRVTEKMVALRIAVKRRSPQEGNTTDFFDAVLFGASADFAEKYLKKGSPCIVQGTIQKRYYTNTQTGEKVEGIEVLVFEIEGTDKSKKSESK